MLDARYIHENRDAVAHNCKARGMAVDIDRFVELYEARLAHSQKLESLNRRANELSAAVKKAADADAREPLIAEARSVRAARDETRSALEVCDADFRLIHEAIPNLTHPDSPQGASEADSVAIDHGITPVRDFDFSPRDHLELGRALDLIDMEAGARVAGHGFYFLKNDAVLLDLALQHFVLGKLIGRGYVPLITPDLARSDVLTGAGFVPRGPETQIYSLADSDLGLIATSEITIAGYHRDEVFAHSDLPRRYCGVSHCFRTEAGAHGKVTRGLYRVHQFTKVEMFAFTTPQDSEAMHREMLAIEREIFDDLAVPYRVLDIACGDLGAAAFRKYDLEAWMPGRGGGDGAYGEVTSTSNCTDYQARRLNIRYKIPGEKGTRLAHTLNGTAVATGRAMIAILENGQNKDGSVTLPKPLHALMGKDTIRPPAGM